MDSGMCLEAGNIPSWCGIISIPRSNSGHEFGYDDGTSVCVNSFLASPRLWHLTQRCNRMPLSTSSQRLISISWASSRVARMSLFGTELLRV
eukprot:1441300-Prymnesium_polylepis.1